MISLSALALALKTTDLPTFGGFAFISTFLSYKISGSTISSLCEACQYRFGPN
jgi:hypothetical protein